ncbi:MAG: adenylosuccinate lyase [Anaerolineae bacterium]|nr:adenylosuccinate lyase [Anaerolineae bacterium]
MTVELLALTPLDGRYARETEPLREYFSEYALIRARARIEISYFIALSKEKNLIRTLTPAEMEMLEKLSADFSLEDAADIKRIETAIRHDVKAVENFLRERLSQTSLADCVEWLHFGLTSEDVNLSSQAIALRDSRDEVILPALEVILTQLTDLARRYKSTPMLARTHGQAAVPTTFGKEMAVFVARLRVQRAKLAAQRFEAKWSGAVGNFNALVVGAPQVDWEAFSQKFLRGLGLEPAEASTQLIPYDNWLEYFQTLQLINLILIDLAQDLWRYISDDYLKLRIKKGEVGSSTMPQKVNPIDLENGEGNLGLANSLFEQFIRKLPISRLQRDLSDSTVRRSFGTALGHTLVAWKSIARGLDKLEADEAGMRSELEAHWEVIAEGAQTILRSAQVSSAYDQVKTLTRGKGFTSDSYKAWVDTLDIDEQVKSRLLKLSPTSYTGLAEKITEDVINKEAP